MDFVPGQGTGCYGFTWYFRFSVLGSSPPKAVSDLPSDGLEEIDSRDLGGQGLSDRLRDAS